MVWPNTHLSCLSGLCPLGPHEQNKPRLNKTREWCHYNTQEHFVEANVISLMSWSQLLPMESRHSKITIKCSLVNIQTRSTGVCSSISALTSSHGRCLYPWHAQEGLGGTDSPKCFPAASPTLYLTMQTAHQVCHGLQGHVGHTWQAAYEGTSWSTGEGGCL